MVRLRWGADTPSDPSDARRRLVDAAEACFRRYGVAKTTVEDVAEEARVSRATVYRYFDGRDSLLLAVLLRHAGGFLDKLQARLAKQPDLATGIVDGIAFTVRSVRRDANLALLFAPESAGMTSAIAGTSDALFALAIEFLRPLLETAQASGDLRPGIEVDDAVEWLVRTILSLLSVEGPRQRTEPQLKSFVRTFVVPSLVVERSPRGRRR